MAGCVSITSGKPVGLNVLNWNENAVEISVEISRSGSDEAVYDEQYTLKQGEVIEREDIVAPRTYSVTVNVVGETTRTKPLSIESCEDQTITVIYEARGGLDIGQNKC